MWGLPLTSEHLVARGEPPLDHLLDTATNLDAIGISGETFLPGHGHSADNLVVWLAGPRVLFGGCFVKSAQSGGLGNTADADLHSWATAVGTVQARYPDADLVIPGHGEPGGPELLAHTAHLLWSVIGPM